MTAEKETPARSKRIDIFMKAFGIGD